MILNIKKCNLVGEDKYIHLIHLETNYKAVYELTWDCLEYIECAVVKDLASRYPWALGKRWVFESSPGPSLPFQHSSYLATCFPRVPWLVEPIQRRLMGSKTSLCQLWNLEPKPVLSLLGPMYQLWHSNRKQKERMSLTDQILFNASQITACNQLSFLHTGSICSQQSS